MRAKDVIGLALSLIIIRMLLPLRPFDKLYYKGNQLVKIKWVDGSVSKLKNGVWIHK